VFALFLSLSISRFMLRGVLFFFFAIKGATNDLHEDLHGNTNIVALPMPSTRQQAYTQPGKGKRYVTINPIRNKKGT